MKFQRGNSPKKVLEVGRWADHLKINFLMVSGTIGYGEETEIVKFKVEGIAIREYLNELEKGRGYIRIRNADKVLESYMKNAFFGTNVIKGNRNPVDEYHIEDLRARIWHISAHKDWDEISGNWSVGIEELKGKNVSYEGGIWTIPEKNPYEI